MKTPPPSGPQVSATAGKIPHGHVRKAPRLAPAFLAVALVLAPLALTLTAQDQATYLEDAHLLSDRLFQTPHDLLLDRAEELKADALAYYMLGVIHEEEGENQQALENFQKALDLDPAHHELARRVAQIRVRRGEASMAVNLLKDTLTVVDDQPDVYLDLARIYALQLRRSDAAVEYATQALEVDPEYFPAYQTILGLHLTRNDLDAAQELLERALEVESSKPEFWVQIGTLFSQLYSRRDPPTEAEAAATLERVYEKGLEHAGGDPNLLGHVADFHILNDQVEQAIPLYEKILEMESPRTAANGQVDYANVREKLARSYRVVGRTDQAIEVLEDIIERDPMRYTTYEILGELLEESGQYERAAANFEQSLTLNPNQPHTYLRTAELFLHRNVDQASTAIEILEQGRERFPDRPEMGYLLALSLREAERYQDALTMFEKTLQAAQRHAEGLVNAIFYFHYGAAAERAGLYDKAAELFRQAIELDPSFAPAYNYLGYMWVDRDENLDEAGELIRRALHYDPENGAYLDSLGWYYFRKGEYEKALQELLRAIENMPDDDPEFYVVYDHVADTYFELGKPTQAIDYWEKAIRMNPGADGITDKIESAREKLTSKP